MSNNARIKQMLAISGLAVASATLFPMSAIAGTAPVGPAPSTSNPPAHFNHIVAGHPQMPRPLANLVSAGRVQVIKSFPAKAGMTGYLVKSQGRYTVVYGRNGYMFAGAMIAPDGHNLTAQYNKQYAPQPDYAAVVKKLESTGHLIDQGSKDAPTLYVFEDPNCIFCHRFEAEAAPLVKAGKLRLKIALVAFLKPSSMGKATAILSAASPAAAMAENEAKYNVQAEEGGIKTQAQPNPTAAAVVNANGKTMRDAGFGGTPAILYKTKDGKWTGMPGMPSMQRLKAMIKGQ